MSSWILPESGVPVSKSTVQQVTNLEGQTDQNKKRSDSYVKIIAYLFNEQNLGDGYLEIHGKKPDTFMWGQPAGDNDVFQD